MTTQHEEKIAQLSEALHRAEQAHQKAFASNRALAEQVNRLQVMNSVTIEEAGLYRMESVQRIAELERDLTEARAYAETVDARVVELELKRAKMYPTPPTSDLAIAERDIAELTHHLDAERQAHANTKVILEQTRFDRDLACSRLEDEQKAHAETKYELEDRRARVAQLELETRDVHVELEHETQAHAETRAKLEALTGELEQWKKALSNARSLASITVAYSGRNPGHKHLLRVLERIAEGDTAPAALIAKPADAQPVEARKEQP